MRPLTGVRGSLLTGAHRGGGRPELESAPLNRECQQAAIALLTPRPKAETIR